MFIVVEVLAVAVDVLECGVHLGLYALSLGPALDGVGLGADVAGHSLASAVEGAPEGVFQNCDCVGVVRSYYKFVRCKGGTIIRSICGCVLWHRTALNELMKCKMGMPLYLAKEHTATQYPI